MGWPRSAWGLGRSACLWRDSECRAARDIFGGETPKWVAASRFGVCICMCAAARQGCRLIKRLLRVFKSAADPRVYNVNENEKTQQKKRCRRRRTQRCRRDSRHTAHTPTRRKPQGSRRPAPHRGIWQVALPLAASRSPRGAARPRPHTRPHKNSRVAATSTKPQPPAPL